MAQTIRPAFHHVTIKMGRLRAMADWYRLVVGVEVTFQDADNARTTNDEADHRVAFLSVPGLLDEPGKVAHSGLHHSAFKPRRAVPPGPDPRHRPARMTTWRFAGRRPAAVSRG